MSRAAAIEEQAAEWLIRRDSHAWGEGEAEALQAWLDASVDHEVAFYRLEAGWATADRLAALRQPERLDRDERSGPRRFRPPARWLALAAALLLVFVGGLIGYRSLIEGPVTYSTVVGGRSTIPLADGSRVELNTDSRLRVEVSAKRRRVWLDRGEAFFEVAHDAAHPFQVMAGSRTITVLGTRFSVRRDGDEVRVNVLEGRVRLDRARGEGGTIAAPAAQPAPEQLVTTGEIAIAGAATELVTQKAAERVDQALAWRDGLVMLDQTPLAEAAAEFNRYNGKKLVIAQNAVAQMTVSGRFQANNVDAFVRLLHRAYGLQVRDQGDRVELSE